MSDQLGREDVDIDVASLECRVCHATMEPAGTRKGALVQRSFQIGQCRACWFSCVLDPWLEFERIYDQNYYEGRGADPLSDYMGEIGHFDRTIRRHEWSGIVEVLRHLVPIEARTSWLDYGCGAGGLVQYLRHSGVAEATGFDVGWAADTMRSRGLPVLSESEISLHAGTFDVVTAIEVIEHTRDPVVELSRMRSLLAPGGILFLTTGNARPYRGHIAEWRYAIPEIHISLFEPTTLEIALRAAGFEPEFPGPVAGWDEIIRFKILKNARRHLSNPLDSLVPWKAVARLADSRFGFSAHPVGRVAPR